MKNTLLVVCALALLVCPVSVQAAMMETLAEWNFNETSGVTTLTDISGNGNDGQVYAGEGWTPVVFNGSTGEFGGSSVIVVDNASGALDLPNGRPYRITVDLVNVPDISNTLRGITGNRNNAADGTGMQFYHWGWPGNKFLAEVGNVGFAAPNYWVGNFTPDNIHAAGDDVQLIMEYTVDALSLTYSVNGGAAATETKMLDAGATDPSQLDYEAAPSGATWVIGARGVSVYNPFVGEIDNLKIEAAKPLVQASASDLGQILEGDSTAFDVTLAAAPAADVTVTVVNPASVSPGEATDPNDLTLNGSQDDLVLSFTPANWDTAQTVTLGAIDDVIAEDTLESLQLTFLLDSTDTDPNTSFAGGYTVPVAVTVVDDDGAGVLVTVTDDGTAVYEGGVGGNPESDTFTVELTKQPSADVVITLTEMPGDPNETVISPTQLTFTAADWDSPQTVTITAIDDTVAETVVENVAAAFTIATDDLAYAAIAVTDLPIEVYENDCGPDSGAGENIADLNNDCKVDLLDFVILAEDYLACTFPNVPECE